MAAVLQARKIQRDSETAHNVLFDSAITPGSLIALLLDTAGSVTGVTALGAAGTVSLAAFDDDYVGFGNNASVYILPGAASGITGLQVTFASEQPIAGLLLEIEDSDDIDGALGIRTGVFSASGTRVDIVTTETDSIGAGFIYTSSGGTAFTPDAGNTNVSGESADTVAVGFYSGALGAPGTKTIGGVMSTSTFCYGFGISFRNSAGAGAPGAGPLVNAQPLKSKLRGLVQ